MKNCIQFCYKSNEKKDAFDLWHMTVGVFTTFIFIPSKKYEISMFAKVVLYKFPPYCQRDSYLFFPFSLPFFSSPKVVWVPVSTIIKYGKDFDLLEDQSKTTVKSGFIGKYREHKILLTTLYSILFYTKKRKV